MSMLVNEVLYFLRAGMEAMNAKLSAVNVAATVTRVIERESLPEVPVAVSVDASRHVLADGEALFRALSNVVRKAVRCAGHAGPVAVTARTVGDSVHHGVGSWARCAGRSARGDLPAFLPARPIA